MNNFEVNWDIIPEEYNWIAFDKDGEMYAYGDKPNPGQFNMFENQVNCKFIMKVSDQEDNLNWRESSQERPKPISKGHPHAELMLEYARDALQNERPWELWECKRSGAADVWDNLYSSPAWINSRNYRRKIESVQIKIDMNKPDIKLAVDSWMPVNKFQTQLKEILLKAVKES